MSSAGARLQTLADGVRAAGVVGAGGGGFPLADKLLARPYRTLIINAAQSEPLICKDWAVLAHYADCVLGGADLLREALGLSKVFLAIRDEFASALPALPAAARQHRVALARLPDIYPLGYEKILKRELLALPMAPANSASVQAPDDVLVINAETLRNLSWAIGRDRPVTTKLVTIAGAVTRPVTLDVPVGTPFADCLEQAGGAAIGDYALFENGVLAGRQVAPEASWVNATTLGYVLLPLAHSAVGEVPPSLAQRRNAFFSHTLAGRTQPMSAAYALFDLAVYRRSRFEFRALKAADELPACVRIAPAGTAGEFSPCVEAGQRVERGQPIARQSDGGTRHASVSGVVGEADRQAITIERSAAN